MNIINQILALDLSLLKSAHSIVSPEYAPIVQIVGELIVFYAALLLISIWLYGSYKRDNTYKMISLSLFFTIVTVFILYAIINLGIPQWRPGAMEISGANALIPHPTDNSFPSGHALFTGALLFALYRHLRSWGLIALTSVVGIVTLLSRVLGGVHYPGDIIGGLILGILGAYILRSLVDIITNKIAPIVIRIAAFMKL